MAEAILLIGGTGTVGRAAQAALHARGLAFTVASRNGPLALDLADPASVEAGARGHHAALLITPIVPEEAAIGVAAVAALRRAGVARIVQLSVHNAEAMADIPHCAAKLPVEDAVLAGPGGTVLRANFFMANDLMIAPAIRQAGVYPLPIGEAGIWPVAPDDIGEAVANALTSDGWEGARVAVCGPEAMTGPSLAANWARVLGRPVVYGGDAVEPFLDAIDHAMPMNPWLRDDLGRMMRLTQAIGCPATPADRAAARAIIGREPTRHIDFARALARDFKEDHA